MRSRTCFRLFFRLLAIMLLLGILGLSPARADYDVAVLFTPSSTNAHPGDTLSYDVTFTNHELFDITLNNISFNPVNPPAGFLSGWIQPILNPSSFTLAAGTSVTSTTTPVSNLFTLILDPALSSDPSFLTTYSGTMAFNDAFNNAVGDVVSQEFTLNVTTAAVPEPAFYQMGAFLGMGLLGMWKMRRKQA